MTDSVETMDPSAICPVELQTLGDCIDSSAVESCSCYPPNVNQNFPKLVYDLLIQAKDDQATIDVCSDTNANLCG